MAPRRQCLSVLLAIATPVAALNIKVTGTTMSDAIKTATEQKFSKPLSTFKTLLRDEDESSVEVQLKVEARAKHDGDHRGLSAHIAEVTAHCKNKHVIHCAATSDDMYTSLDDLSDTLMRKLRKLKERKMDVKQNRRRDSKEELASVLSESDEDDDEGFTAAAGTSSGRAAAVTSGKNLELVRKKSFAMDPISLEDAITCLDYIDHDFYVFRNAQTDEVNVVYRRNSGGVGHIEPERD